MRRRGTYARSKLLHAELTWNAFNNIAIVEKELTWEEEEGRRRVHRTWQTRRRRRHSACGFCFYWIPVDSVSHLAVVR